MIKTIAILFCMVAISKSEITSFEKSLSNLEENKNSETVLDAAHKLRNLSLGRKDNPELYQKYFRLFRDAIISVPDYASYLIEDMESKRKLLDEDNPNDLYASEYDKARREYLIGVLPCLPSPESVKALGEYLADERDATPPHVKEYREFAANAYLASVGLSQMELNDRPVPSGAAGGGRWREALQKHRAWYSDVKSGKSTFSFYAQPYSYRFSPDGTIEKKHRDVTKDVLPAKVSASENSLTSANEIRRIVFVMVGALIVLSVAIWFKARRKMRAS